MDFLKKTNIIRRNLTHRMTKNIGNSSTTNFIPINNREDIKRILICRPNQRLGNQLLMTPLVQEVINTFPNSKIDLFVKGNLAPIIFKNYSNINKIIQLPKKPFKNLIQYVFVWLSIRKKKYNIVINVDKGSSSGRLSTKFANSTYKFFDDENEYSKLKYKDYKHLAKHPVYSLRFFLSTIGISNNVEMAIPSLDLKLNSEEITEGKKMLNQLIVNKEQKTICLFTYATGNKCYSELWWMELLEKLKKEFKNLNIIEVLPVENVSQIAFKIPTFYSKDIRQIGSLIANTDVFISADSGIMHLASSVQTPTVGLFSVTDMDKYQPYNKNSLALNTNILSTNEIIKKIETITRN
ncbi:glycosyltransferase family 9 protein [Flavobacterium sp. ZE23DGlu08]|uniref:glycosyltransferase family 9 protein n=1 Tax=Flavobacterium sp. ZE23DGlu08 TaxID=3059026 RepID=UPI00265F273F|nr:glycosyltransferase family 9 protein [Flavobacterium sp. ZE23DGlu08]WKL43080.1 glycosyltransferase family 9 protein [Flavobacterium sp. ZE23DGlu08]